MKIVTSSTGKEKLIISKKDWLAMGKKTGWLNKIAYNWGGVGNIADVDDTPEEGDEEDLGLPKEDRSEEVEYGTAEDADTIAEGKRISALIKRLGEFIKTGILDEKFKNAIINIIKNEDPTIEEVQDNDIKEYLVNKINGDLERLSEKSSRMSDDLGSELDTVLTIVGKQTSQSNGQVLMESISNQLVELDELGNFSINNITPQAAEAQATTIINEIKTQIKELAAINREAAMGYFEQLKASIAQFNQALKTPPEQPAEQPVV